MRLLCQAHNARADLRRMLFRKLSEQVRGLRRGRDIGRLLLLRMHTPREGPGRMPQNHQSWQLEDRSVLPKEELQEPLAGTMVLKV